jgi:hypothetical protein
MNPLLIFIGISVAAFLGLLAWSVRKRAAQARSAPKDIDGLTVSCKHVTNLSQIRQALDPADMKYLRERLNGHAFLEARRERRRVAARFLEGLHEDFEHLMNAAQFVATFSPEVEAKEEWKRFRLRLEFELGYRLVKMKCALGGLSFRPMGELANMISSLALDLERAVNEIGAATALSSNRQSADR